MARHIGSSIFVIPENTSATASNANNCRIFTIRYSRNVTVPAVGRLGNAATTPAYTIHAAPDATSTVWTR
jgi:hypothetical protein